MAMFADVDTKPTLEGMRTLFDLFDSATPAGAAMKSAITGALNAIMKRLPDLIHMVRRFFLHIIIFGLQAYVHVWIPMSKHMTLVKAGLIALGIIITAFAVAGTVAMIMIAGGTWSFAAAVLAATWPILAIGAGIALVSAGAYLLYQNWDKVTAALGRFGISVGEFFLGVWKHITELPGQALQLGKDLIMGLVNGIMSMNDAVARAIIGIGKKAVDTFRSVLGLHSPSLVFQQLGLMTGQGLALGMQASNDNVQSAGAGMGIAAARGTMASAKPQASAPSGATVGDVHIQINIDGSGSPQETAEALNTKLAIFFENLGLTQGLGNAA
jgi:hypothetical protein